MLRNRRSADSSWSIGIVAAVTLFVAAGSAHGSFTVELLSPGPAGANSVTLNQSNSDQRVPVQLVISGTGECTGAGFIGMAVYGTSCSPPVTILAPTPDDHWATGTTSKFNDLAFDYDSMWGDLADPAAGFGIFASDGYSYTAPTAVVQLMLNIPADTGEGSYALYVGNVDVFDADWCTESCEARPFTIVIDVEPPSITQQPTDQNVCMHDSATFSVTATGSPPLSYQWRRGGTDGSWWYNLTDGGNISGTTTPTLTINPVDWSDENYAYDVVVTNPYGSATSNTVRLSTGSSWITQQPASQSRCPGQSATFSVDTAVTPLSYRWYKGGTPLSDGGNVSGATTRTLTISSVSSADAGMYSVMIRYAACPDVSYGSMPATLTVDAAVNITQQPTDQSRCVGQTATFSVAANGAAPLSYQWRRGGSALSDGGSISGATTAALTISPVGTTDAGDYDVVVNSLCGSATSAPAILTVNIPPNVTQQPVNHSACAGGSTTFPVEAEGAAPLSYQWQKNVSGTWTDISDAGHYSGVTTPTRTISSLDDGDIADYRCVVSNTCSVTSNAAALALNQPPVVSPISNAVAGESAPYTGPTPTLTQGTPPILWSLMDGPTDMTIDPATGVVTWADPSRTGSPFDITIRAANACGVSDTLWTLSVLAIPVIADIPDALVTAMPYSVTAQVQPEAGAVTWSVVAGPTHLTIDAATGAVSWPDPLDSAMPYAITIRATNIAGTAEKTWSVTIRIPPDASITAGPAPGATICADSTSFTWSGSDNSTPSDQLVYAWRIDAGEWSSCGSATGQALSSLADGNHTFEVVAQDLAGNTDPTPASRTFNVDLTAAVVSGVAASPAPTSCTIVWTTDQPATSQVEYGTTEAYGSATPLDSSAITVHSVALTDLVPNTTYYFRVRCTDVCGRETVAAGSFTTPLPPDLQVVSLGIPSEAWTGQSVDVSWRVTNAGQGGAASVWKDCVYLSADNQVGNDQELACLDRPVPLAVGDHYDRTGTVTIPAVAEGNYWIIFRIDAAGTLLEVDESNNASIIGPISVHVIPCPDLAPSAPVIANAQVVAGGVAYIDFNVINQGTGATNAPFWYDRVYLSADQAFDDDDRAISPDFPNQMALNPGESYRQTVHFTVPADMVGDYYVIVKGDTRGQMAECDEANNTAASSNRLTIRTAGVPAVLTVTEVALSDANPWAGDTITVTWKLTNTGELPSGWFEIDHIISLSRDSDPNSLGAQFLVQHVAGWSGSLEPGQSTPMLSANATLLESNGGQYFIVVWPDPHQDVPLAKTAGSAPINVYQGIVADLVVGQLVVPANGIAGQSLSVNWVTRNAANNATLVDRWDDSVILSRDADLRTTADNITLDTYHWTGGPLGFDQNYSGSLNVVLPNDASGAYTLFVCADTADVVFEGADPPNNNCAAASVSVDYRPPDLQVSDVQVLAAGGQPAASLPSGSIVTVQWQVQNAGTGATAAATWTDRIMLTGNNGGSGNQIEMDKVTHTGILPAGQGYTATRNIEIPVGFVYTAEQVSVCVDGQHAVYESDDSNNCRISNPFAVVFGGSDLTVSSVSLLVNGSPPTGPVAAGSELTVQWQVRNQGPGPTFASQWKDVVRISLDDTVDSQDAKIGEVERLGPLNAAEVYTTATTVRVPIDSIGEGIRIFVCTDAEYKVVEQADDNNCASAAPITTVWGLPDLVVTEATVTPGVPAGQAINLAWTVRNGGGPTATSAAWADVVYLSANSYLDSSDTLLGIHPHEGGLAYGQTYTVNQANIQVPAGLVGSFYVIVCADGAVPGTVQETNEANNSLSTSAYVNLGTCSSNLTVTTVDSPATGLSGQTTTVRWRVTNNGPDATYGGQWRDVLYLSRDQYLDRQSDTYLGYLHHNGVLSPSASYDAQLDVRIPSGLTGPYYVFAVTDGGSVVCEQDEDDNVGYDGSALLVALPPPADLTVTGITVPSAATLGDTITVNWTIANLGEFQAEGSWHDSVYLSADAAWDLGDQKIGTVPHSGGLAPNASYNSAVTGSVPGVVPGPYYVIVRADILNEARESAAGETNNVGASGEQVTVGVTELALGVPFAAQLTASGTSHYYRVRMATAETLRVTLDAANNVGANEVYIRYGQVPDRGHFDLPSTDPLQADQTVIVPDTRAGDYYILVYADLVQGGPQDYTILAEIIPFSISSVVPSGGSNTGPVTMRVLGGRFQPDTLFSLIRDPADSVQPGAFYYQDQSQAFVTFDLTAAAPGLRDLAAVNPDGARTVKTQAFEVIAGGGAQLRAWIISPGLVRANFPFVIRIGYANVGTADMPAPLLELSPSRVLGMSLASAKGPFITKPIRMLAVNQDGPAGILPPGGHGTIVVYTQGSGEGSLGQGLIHRAVGEVIDWRAEEARLRPADMSEGKWLALLDRIQARTGSTWSGLEKELAKVATRLWQRGEQVYDFDQLWSAYLVFTQDGYLSRITGRLLDADTLAALANTKLVLRTPDGEVLQSVLTSADGSFEAWVPPGTYEPIVEQRYFDPPQILPVGPDQELIGVELAAKPLPGDPPPPTPLEIPDNAPRLARDHNGDVHMVWKRGGDLWHAENTGTGWQATGAIGQVEALNASLAAAPSDAGPDAVTLVWQGGTGNASELYYSIGKPASDGFTWTVGTPLTQDTVSDRSPAVVPASAGTFLVVWLKRDDAIEDDTDLYYQVVAPTLATAQIVPARVKLAPELPALGGGQFCINIASGAGTTLPGWVPIVGGEHGWKAATAMCLAQGECNGSFNAEGQLTGKLGDQVAFAGSGKGSGKYKTDNEACEYVLDSFTLELQANTTAKVPIYGLPRIKWVKAEVGASLTIDLLGRAWWIGVQPWAARPNGGEVNFGGGGGLYGEAKFGPDSNAPWIAAEIKGTVSARAVWRSTTGVVFHGYCVQASAAAKASLFSYKWKWGPWGTSCPGQLAFAETGPPGAVIVRRSGELGDEMAPDETLTIAVDPLTGTGAVYPGSTVVIDVSQDLKNDGPPSVVISQIGEILATWTKDSSDPNVELGGAVMVASYSGVAWSAPIALTSAADFNNGPAIVFDSANVPMVVWSHASAEGLSLASPVQELLDATERTDLLYSRRMEGAWSSPLPLAPLDGQDRDLHLAAGDGGLVLAAWINTESGTGSERACAAVWSNGSWSQPAVLSATPSRCLEISCEVLHGTLTAVWVADRDGDTTVTPWDQTIYSATYSGGNWSAPVPLAKEPLPASTPSLTTSVGDRTGLDIFQPPAECCGCKTDADCDDHKPSTDDLCIDHKCEHRPKKCDDGNECTEDVVNEATGECEHTLKPDCDCSMCDDHNVCTHDVCDPFRHGCIHLDTTSPFKDDDCIESWCDPVEGWQAKVRECCPNCPDVKPPIDPNEKVGPAGYGPQAFVGAQQELPFTIYFENLPTAPGWAAQVTITDQLSANLDWRTFRLGEVAFGDQQVIVPNGRPHYVGELTLASGLVARTRASIDAENGLVTWVITAIDPATGEMVADPRIGLLAPNNPEVHDGEGHVTYMIRPRTGLPTGTVVTNKATIVFDNNEPIDTNTVSYTLDADAPSSAVDRLPVETPDVSIPLSWSGQDGEGGSGLADFTIMVSVDGAAYTSAFGNTTAAAGVFTAKRGHTYRFYSLARDNAGNVEASPPVPDATVTTLPPWPGDFDADGDADLADYLSFRACFNGPNRPAASACTTDADLDSDTDVDLADFLVFQACFNGPNRPAKCR